MRTTAAEAEVELATAAAAFPAPANTITTNKWIPRKTAKPITGGLTGSLKERGFGRAGQKSPNIVTSLMILIDALTCFSSGAQKSSRSVRAALPSGAPSCPFPGISPIAGAKNKP